MAFIQKLLLFVELSFLELEFLGIKIINYVYFAALILAAAILGKTATYVIKTRFEKFAKKTKTKLDDVIYYTIEKPLFYFFILFALLIGNGILNIKSELINSIYINTLQVFALVLVTWCLIRLVDALKVYYLHPWAKRTDTALDDQLVPIIVKVSKILVVAMMAIIILSSFGYDVTALVAGLGIGGLAVAFAAKETIADVFGGASIFASKPFVVGDYVTIGNVSGTVEEIGLRYTRLRTAQNKFVTIPNSTIARETIINHSGKIPKGIDMTIGIIYESTPKTLNKAIEIIKKIIKETPGTVKDDDKIIVVFDSFGDFSLNIFVRYFIEDRSRWREIKHEINAKIFEEFAKHKIEFAYPTQTIFLKNQG